MTKARAPLFARAQRKWIVSRSVTTLADGKWPRSKGAALFYLSMAASRPSPCSATTTVSKHPATQIHKRTLLPINHPALRKRALHEKLRLSQIRSPTIDDDSRQ